MSLPNKAIDRLFERLGATYGSAWTRQWADVPLSEVKTVWAHELSGYANESGLKAIAWVLENLPEKCPNTIEFRNLCRRAPAPAVPLLPEPKADPERVAAELAKLASVRKAAASSTRDHKAWAKALMARHNAGDPIKPIQLRFAREALRLSLIGGEA